MSILGVLGTPARNVQWRLVERLDERGWPLVRQQHKTVSGGLQVVAG